MYNKVKYILILCLSFSSMVYACTNCYTPVSNAGEYQRWASGATVVLDGSSQKVAVDSVGCKPGDWVICVGSSAAREAAGSKSYPSDLTIVGIIDHWEPESEL